MPPLDLIDEAHAQLQTMLTCIPQTFCTWDYRVYGSASGPGLIEFNFLTEQGSISVGGVQFIVRKHGPLSGHWTLERDATVCADAHKPHAMFRSFEMRIGDVQVAATAQFALTRCFDILMDGVVVGTIEPAHPFTRRAFIKCSASVPELAQLFSFWLAVITWRRAANNNAATSS